MNILLQILDEGPDYRRTAAAQVSFEHTIIIMTSNAGSNITGTAAGFNKSAELLSREKARESPVRIPAPGVSTTVWTI